MKENINFTNATYLQFQGRTIRMLGGETSRILKVLEEQTKRVTGEIDVKTDIVEVLTSNIRKGRTQNFSMCGIDVKMIK